MNSYSEWIPLISGFGNTEFLGNVYLSVGLGIVFILSILAAIYFIIYRTNAIPITQSFVLFASLLLANINSLKFSCIYPALLCIAWMQFCLLNAQFFVGFLLLGLSSLFYAPMIWIFPLAIFSVIKYNVDDLPRTFVKAFAGFITPYIYLLTFRWLSYNDAHVFLQHFVEEITDINMPFHLLHITDYFLIFVVAYLLLRSIVFFYTKTPDGLPAYIFKTEIITLLIFTAMGICFCGNSRMPLLNMLALPASIILAYYYKNCKSKGRVQVEFIFLGIAVVISLLGGILN